MKVIVFLSILLLCYFGYQELFDKDVAPLEDEDLETVLKSDTEQGRKLRASFQKILPQVEGSKSPEDGSSPKVDAASAPDQPMSVDDTVERFQSLQSTNEEEATTFLRWSLFMSDQTGESKEEILNGVMPHMSKEEILQVTRDIVSRNSSEPALYKKALAVQGQYLNKEEEEALIRTLWSQIESEGTREMISEYASANGITLP